MDESAAKFIAMAALFVEVIVFACSPYVIFGVRGQRSKAAERLWQQVTSYLNCFAGGVFFAVTMLHLLPEGLEKVEEYFETKKIDMKYPLYQVIVAGGFFLIAVVEQVTHMLMRHHLEPGGSESSSQAVLTSAKGNVSDIGESPSLRNLSNPELATVTPPFDRRQGEGRISFNLQEPPEEPRPRPLPPPPRQEDPPFVVMQLPEPRETAGSNVDYEVKSLHTVSASTLAEAIVADSDTKPKDDNMAWALKRSEGSPMRTIMLLTAMSFHTVFDGFAVGLTSGTSRVWQIFGAVCLHKSLVAMCLGTELFMVYAQKPYRAFLVIFCFALMSPIGIALGMVLTSRHVDYLAQTLTNGVLEGVATGTFLYITFFEILNTELVERRGFLRLFLVLVGFGAIAAAKVMDGD